MADRSLSYYLGPDLSQGLLNIYNAGRGLLGLMSPGADVRDAVQSSQSAMQNLGQGNVGSGLLDLVYTPAALAGMFIPGSIGGTRRVGEAAVDEIIGLVDDVDPSMPSKLAHPSAAKGFGEAGSNLDPTRTGFVFKDVQRKPTLSRAENRAISGGMKPGDVAVLPIRSLIATQSKVNADFADAASSAGELPYVVKKNGEYFVFDGHHRITKVAAEGGQNARVRLVDLDGTDRSAPLLEYDPVKSAANKKELDDLRAALSDYLPMDEASRMARAREMGFDTDVYHGTNENITAFDPEKSMEFGESWFSSSPKVANDFAMYRRTWPGANIMPAKIRGNFLEFDGGGKPIRTAEQSLERHLRVDLSGGAKMNYGETVGEYARRKGYDGIRFSNVTDDVPSSPNMGQPSDIYAVFDPKNIRSRFAKFDPSKKDSANILAGVGGGLLATGVAGRLGAGAYGQQEQ